MSNPSYIKLQVGYSVTKLLLAGLDALIFIDAYDGLGGCIG